jgi:hypothetical protein
MAQPYLDSAGNVNTAVANDLQNLTFAMRQQVVVPAPLAALAATGSVVAADAITGLAQTVTDV